MQNSSNFDEKIEDDKPSQQRVSYARPSFTSLPLSKVVQSGGSGQADGFGVERNPV